MDSSPDLSLKLRRGSSDSRDTFYMDFAQGIDSDIEEVDNSAITREPQQPPTPPPPVSESMSDMDLPTSAVLPPPPLPSMLQHQPLPTLSEHDDLPPTPPLLQDEENAAGSIDMTSPPVSPTTSVLEMIPPPPLAETPPMQQSEQAAGSPPLETEDEADEQNDGDVDEDDDDDYEKSSPPPPLPPLPAGFSYMHGSDAGGGDSPPITKSPSTSPSPPVTPPPCPELSSVNKIVSPPLPHVSQMPPLTPPSDSDQSQPDSPPPLPPHPDMSMQEQVLNATPPPPQTGSPGAEEILPSTPPAEFMETDDLIAAVVAATLGSASPDLLQEVLDAGVMDQQILSEDIKSLNDDESTTITTPPTNGYSASSIVVPQVELDYDYGLNLADIPPPADLDSQAAEEQEAEEEIEVDDEKTPTSEPAPEDVITDEHTTADTPAEEAEVPITSPLSASVSGSPKKSGSLGQPGSGGTSHSASRSGSIRASLGSRSGSIKAVKICSSPHSIASAASAAMAAATAAVISPQPSIKSIRSQQSVKSGHSSKQAAASPVASRQRTPSEAESPTSIRSPTLIRSSAGSKDTPTKSQSPASVASPPRLYSPPLRQTEAELDYKQLSEKAERKGSGLESLPLAAGIAAAAGSESLISPTVPSTLSTSTTLSYQDEQHVMRPHLSSHHHYHLPHQFQHPHHQNHHPHMHGSMPVPTPIVPASYAATTLLRSSLSAAGSGAEDECMPMPAASLAATSSTASNMLLSETVSHASVSPAKASHHRVTIDESNLQPTISTVSMGGDGDGPGSEPPSPGSSSQQQLTNLTADRQTGHLTLMYHSHQLSNFPVLPAIKRHRPSFIYPPMPRVKAGDALATLFSALYGKLLVVMGVAFPMAEVISTYIPPSFYEVYYLYLYIGSMIFLFFMYATLLWGRPKLPTTITSPTKSSNKRRSTSGSESLDESDTESNSTRHKHMPPAMTSARRPSLLSPLGRQHHYGSFYLRMGAVAFGIGSMIYSGLEFGQYFELNPDTKCHNVLLALTPATRMAFIFIQMYFIFLNNEQIKVYRYKIIARFGLMHMIGTNLAVWLNVLIQETKHEILTFYNPENRTLRISHRIPALTRGHAVIAATEPSTHLRLPRGLKGPYQIFECRRTNIIGTLVQDASPFLFPCTIEYSLICAAILYVMWRSISRPQTPTPQRPDMISSPMKRSPHHYSVDCARAHKGLFVGILILVLTIISLIIFFVLISRPEFVALAVTEVTICELLIYGTATIATLIGMIQVRVLQYDAYRSFSLDDILLVGAQTGSFLYNIFTVIAGHFSIRHDDMLVPLNALASMVQTAGQTMFILDASRRQAVSPEHMRKKPGREIVTFMLVVNLAMWAISTLEKSRAESHPIQLNFYGLWAWTIITHVSMPLAIFYRFHSTVCLCEIWKRAYKLKPTYM